MAGRGRGRARSLLNSDIANSLVGGLTDKTPDSTTNDTNTTAAAASSSSTSSIHNKNSSSSESATLSVADIQTILQDSRTYSDQSGVKKVLVLVQNFVRTEKDVKTVACTIYQKCMEDTSLAKRGAEICDGLTGIEIGNMKFRNCLLSLVQADYKIRSEIMSSSPAHFNGFVAFLCEIFNTMRTGTGEVFKVLSGPIFDCFNLVLGIDKEIQDEDELVESKDVESLDEDACSVLAFHLQFVGRLLEGLDGVKMNRLMNRVRTCIIHGKSSPRVRCSLLEALEGYSRSWEDAPNDTTKYYCEVEVDLISGLML